MGYSGRRLTLAWPSRDTGAGMYLDYFPPRS